MARYSDASEDVMRSGRTITAIVVAALAAGAVAPAPAPALDPTVPPEVLAPADGATVQAGSAVTFRVRTDVGDDYLWVHVSTSPTPVDSCGTIDDDVDLVGLDPTAPDSAESEGTADVSPSFTFWLNRAGTYYWQAYRIHYPDGCIEAPVRTLVVTGVRPIEIGPQPLEPADGATMQTGPVTFRVSAMPVDQYLWVYVSRSPQLTGLGGLIGDDVTLAELKQTTDPTVWAVTPDYYTFASFWMNTPGTYYWQPHRISSFGDPDGWVEGPVRSFTLTSNPAPAPTPDPLAVHADPAGRDRPRNPGLHTGHRERPLPRVHEARHPPRRRPPRSAGHRVGLRSSGPAAQGPGR